MQVTVQVTEGDAVDAGRVVAPIEAMRSEVAITAPVARTVGRRAVGPVQQEEGGDIPLVLARAGPGPDPGPLRTPACRGTWRRPPGR